MHRSELTKKIAHLRNLGPRAAWVDSTRELLLAEIRRQGDQHPAAVSADAAWGQGVRFWPGFTGKVRNPVVGFVGALGLILASSLTVNAAFYSLPGDTLYKMKLVFERTQLAFVSDSARKVELKVEFARNRVKELGKLVSQGADKKNDGRQVSRAVSRFTEEVASVHQDLQHLPADRRAVFNLAVSVGQAGTELADNFKSELNKVEKSEVSQAVRHALAAAEETSYRALEAAITAPEIATSSPPVAAAEIRKYFKEKIVRLRDKVETLQPATASPASLAGNLLLDLDAALLDVEQDNFSAALTTIFSVRENIDKLEAEKDSSKKESQNIDSGPAPVDATGAQTAPDSPATSTGGLGDSTSGGTEGGGETTQGLISG